MTHTLLTESQNRNTLTAIFFLWIFISLDPADSKRSIAGSDDNSMHLTFVSARCEKSVRKVMECMIYPRTLGLPDIPTQSLVSIICCVFHYIMLCSDEKV